MKTLTVMVQVMEGSPSGYVTQETVSVEEELDATIQEKEKKQKKKRIGGLKIDRVRFQSGFVRFEMYRPNEDRSELVKASIHETTQEDFISMLQFGVLRTKEGEAIDFFKR